jgi:uncharacterized protein (DUF58 family)
MLDPEIVRRVREIQIRAGRQVAEVLAGHYVSVFKGRGVEFDEVRPYLPGDEIRSIDWNVTARTGEPYVKRYVEERQLTILLLVDISRSQEFGSGQRSKRETAAELAALVALSAIQNDDRVGLLLFDDQLRHYIPPRKGQRHALRVIRDVLSSEYQQPISPRPHARSSGQAVTSAPPAGIAVALEHVQRVIHRRAICFVVSDFWDESSTFIDGLKIARRRHDVVAVQVIDPRELQLPSAGLVQVIDPESGSQTWIDTSSPRVRDAFAKRAHQRLNNLQQQFRESRIDSFQIHTTKTVVEPIVRFFRMREGRVRHR